MGFQCGLLIDGVLHGDPGEPVCAFRHVARSSFLPCVSSRISRTSSTSSASVIPSMLQCFACASVLPSVGQRPNASVPPSVQQCSGLAVLRCSASHVLRCLLPSLALFVFPSDAFFCLPSALAAVAAGYVGRGPRGFTAKSR